MGGKGGGGAATPCALRGHPTGVGCLSDAMSAAGGGGDGGGDGGGGESAFWSSLLKWSLAQQENGNVAGAGRLGAVPEDTEAGEDGAVAGALRPTREISKEEREWFYEAMQARTEDVAVTMQSIASALASKASASLPPEEVAVRAALLEDLAERVESIDHANDLDAVGGLAPVLEALRSPHEAICARAAEVVSIVVQNNPKAQARALELGAMGHLLTLVEEGDSGGAKAAAGADADAAPERTQQTLAMALLALGSLVRGDAAATSALVLGSGPRLLLLALRGSTPKVQRRALHLMAHLAAHHEAAGAATAAAGGVRAGGACLLSPDAAVRQAALSYLLSLARVIDFDKNPGALADYRAPALAAALGRVSAGAEADADARREELVMARELRRMLGE